MAGNSTREDRPSGWGLPIGVGTGAGIGMILGILLDQLAMGMITGAAIGLLLGAGITSTAATPRERRGRVIAAGVALVTAGAVIVVWVLMR